MTVADRPEIAQGKYEHPVYTQIEPTIKRIREGTILVLKGNIHAFIASTSTLHAAEFSKLQIKIFPDYVHASASSSESAP